MCKLTVVVDKKTGKLIPFEYKEPFHEVVIVASGGVNLERCIVRSVDTKNIDWDSGYVTMEGYGKKSSRT